MFAEPDRKMATKMASAKLELSQVDSPRNLTNLAVDLNKNEVSPKKNQTPGLVNINYGITMLFMGKSTISTGPFSSSQTVRNCQAG